MQEIPASKRAGTLQIVVRGLQLDAGVLVACELISRLCTPPSNEKAAKSHTSLRRTPIHGGNLECLDSKIIPSRADFHSFWTQESDEDGSKRSMRDDIK